MHTLLVPLVTLLNDLDPTPVDKDIKAGFPALFIFLGMFVVILLLGWSLTRHLRRTESNRQAGIYPGSPPETADSADATGASAPHPPL